MDNTAYVGVASIKVDRRGARLREVAYRAIKESILRGLLGPELPLAEERLAAVLEISRTPVREALVILEHEGLIESIAHKGLYVKAVTAGEFLEMAEAIALIEPELARRAAQNAGEPAAAAGLAAMTAAMARARAAIPGNVAGLLAACRDFQREMGRCADNAYLTALLLNVEERADLYLITRWRALPEARMRAAVADREAMLDAILAGDVERAAGAALAHGRSVGPRWQDLFGQE